ncbi:hypothetical protein T484DRAFT_1955938 [Baffinella frigidus]|nr:hypothetical protein T484DRAFT_1955938 [Cryptophyta sp. CCMP2293]|mmetsp:Transcript_44961/g.106839  ORF Transcript_44961/g.106839 Transcript_44961/m.106839 type:complete len:155 (-) Transcript_44961:59-523(-)
MRMRTGAPALAAAGLVCAVLVTLVALGGRGDEGQRVALEDPTVTTGDLNADKWRNSIKDLWAKPLGMGVPQPGYKKKSAIVPSLVLNMPMQDKWSHDPNPHMVASMSASMRRMTVRRQNLWTKGPNLTKGIDPDTKTFIESGFVPDKIPLLGNA